MEELLKSKQSILKKVIEKTLNSLKEYREQVTLNSEISKFIYLFLEKNCQNRKIRKINLNAYKN